MKPVTDPSILKQLETSSLKPVNDPDILRKLNGEPDTPKPIAPPQSFGEKAANFGRNVIGSVVEPIASMATGTVAKPISDVAGLAALGKEMISPTQGGGDPAGFKREVQQRLTYEPKTTAGKFTTEYNPLALAGKAVGYGAEKVGNTVAGDGTSPFRSGLGRGVEETLIQAPSILGAKYAASKKAALPSVQAELDVERGLNAPRDAIRSQSQKAGLITPPEGISWISGIPGLNKIGEWDSAANAPNFNRLVAENFGLPKGVALTADELSRIRSERGGAYRAVIAAGDTITREVPVPSIPSNILGADGQPTLLPPSAKTFTKTGFAATPEFTQSIKSLKQGIEAEQSELPHTFKAFNDSINLLNDYSEKDTFTPATTIKAIRQLRKDAATEFKSDDPAKLASAFTRKEIASNLESMIEANLEKSGQSKLLEDFRTARTIIRQTYDVEYALDNTGNINARKLMAIGKKGPLTGNLKLIADYAEAYPEGAQKVSSGRQAISPWDWMFGAGSLAAGHPGVAAVEMAGRAGIPYLAQKGLLQKRTPSYTASKLPSQISPPLGAITSEEAQRRKLTVPKP